MRGARGCTRPAGMWGLLMRERRGCAESAGALGARMRGGPAGARGPRVRGPAGACDWWVRGAYGCVWPAGAWVRGRVGGSGARGPQVHWGARVRWKRGCARLAGARGPAGAWEVRASGACWCTRPAGVREARGAGAWGLRARGVRACAGCWRGTRRCGCAGARGPLTRGAASEKSPFSVECCQRQGLFIADCQKVRLFTWPQRVLARIVWAIRVANNSHLVFLDANRGLFPIRGA